MSRPSKYHNEKTEDSKLFAERLFEGLDNFSVEYAEQMQIEYGVSDIDLANFLRLNRSVISSWKNGKRDITDYNKLTMYLFFKFLNARSDG